MAKQAQSYINTLVFAIITGLVTLVLLIGILFSSAMNEYAYVLVTVEVGLIAIVSYALYNIIAYESKMKRLSSTASKNALLAQNCPDYYTVGYDATGAAVCKNFFKGRSPSGESFAMFYVPSQQYTSRMENARREYVFSGNPPSSSIAMKDFENKRVEDTCKQVQGRPPENDTAKTVANNYVIPWTDMRPKCDGFSY